MSDTDQGAIELSNLPVLRYKLRVLDSQDKEIGSMVLDNINLGQAVFLRLKENGDAENAMRFLSEPKELAKYSLDKQFVVLLSSDTEVLELEPIQE